MEHKVSNHTKQTASGAYKKGSTTLNRSTIPVKINLIGLDWTLEMFAVLFLVTSVACSSSPGHTGKANAHMHRVPFEKLLERFEAPERKTWQKPGAVVAQLGDISGKVIADIGCGSGYFSFRMQEVGARVLCIDVDERFLSFVESRKREAGIADNAIETRLVPYDSPGLAAKEVDVVLIVNTYHHIEDREAYFMKVRKGMRPGGSLVIVDYKAKRTRVGPPQHIRVSTSDIMSELREAGFTSFTVDQSLLPHQYIVTANEE
jgi:SAM-dependent methyltransferase